jgi:hypothetical protein
VPDTTTTTTAPATTTTTAPATSTTTTAPATTSTTTTAPAQPAWHGYTEPADVEYVKNKGWQGAPDAVKGYREVEKLIGRDPSTLLVMPRADDPAGLRSVFSKLGLPETADKYEFAKPPEGVTPDASYEKFARDTFHKIGLLPNQVKELTGAHNNYVKEVLTKQESDYNLSVETDKKALIAEWKGGHERMMNAAKTAANALGFDADMIDGIERAKGYAGTWKFFAELGKKMGEDGFVASGDTTGFSGTLTPAEAKSQWEAMKLDATAIAALKDVSHPGHKAAKAKQDSLFKVMYPAG